MHCKEGQEEEQKKGTHDGQPVEKVNTRKGFYPDDIANTFGVSVEEYNKQTEVREMDGYISMAMLTGAEKTNTGSGAPVLERRDE